MFNEEISYQSVINNKYDTDSNNSFFDFSIIFIFILFLVIFFLIFYYVLVEFKARFCLSVKKRIIELESKPKK